MHVEKIWLAREPEFAVCTIRFEPDVATSVISMLLERWQQQASIIDVLRLRTLHREDFFRRL